MAVRPAHGGHGGVPRPARASGARRAFVVAASVGVFLVLAVVPAACVPSTAYDDRAVDEQARTDAGSAFAAQYRALHGATDPELLRVAAPAATVGSAAIRDAGYVGPISLPDYLPVGFGLAAPFRGTGSGAALPNPQVWETGYAVTYTDGLRRLTIVVDAAEAGLGEGWEPIHDVPGSSDLEVREALGLFVVRPKDEGESGWVVVGERMQRLEVLRVAAGLTARDG